MLNTFPYRLHGTVPLFLSGRSTRSLVLSRNVESVSVGWVTVHLGWSLCIPINVESFHLDENLGGGEQSGVVHTGPFNKTNQHAVQKLNSLDLKAMTTVVSIVEWSLVVLSSLVRRSTRSGKLSVNKTQNVRFAFSLGSSIDCGCK